MGKRMLKALRVTLIIGIVLIVIYSFVGLVGVPWAFKAKIIPELAQRLGKPMSVKEVKFNPFAFTLGVEGLALDEHDGSPLAGFEELFVDFDIMSLLGETYRFDSVRLILPYGNAVVRSDGTFNLAEIGVSSDSQVSGQTLSKENLPPPDNSSAFGLPPIDVDLFTIEQGFVEFRDQSRPKEFIADIVPIQITLRNFSTSQGREQSYFIVAEMEEGEVMQWDGTLSLNPVHSKGRVDFKGLGLPTLWEFVQDQLQFEITKGVLDLGGQYKFSGGDKPDIVFTEGSVQLREMKLSEKGKKEEIVSVPHIALTGMVVDVPKQAVVINSIQSRGSRLIGWLTKDGAFNFQSFFGVSASPDSLMNSRNPKDSPADPPPWDVVVKDVMFTGFSIDFEDRMPDQPVKYRVENLDLNLKNFRADLTEPIQIDGGLTLNETGMVKVNGTVGFNPVKSDVSLELVNIGLRPFQTYFSPFVQFELSGGVASFKGKTLYQAGSPKTHNIRLAGELIASDVSIMDPVQAKQFMGWKKLAFQDLTVEMNPIRVNVGEVLLNEPSVQGVINPEGHLNFSRVFSSPTSAAKHEGAAARQVKSVPSSRAKFFVKNLQLVDLTASFTDLSVEPMVVTHIQELSGSIQGLSTKQRSRADVALIGTMDDVATLRVEGQINPLEENTYADLAVFLTNWDLKAVSPYSRKYLGYPIDKGKVSVNLQYTSMDNILAGENEVVADQLTLGDKVDSPDASNLPIPLAMAVFKDRDGRINIDLPVRGDLTDPEFTYGGILWESLLDLIMRAVSSPFTVIGDMLGVNAEDLEFVAFQPGQVHMDEEELIKLERVVGALDLRPGLQIEIRGQFAPEVDSMKLAEERLMAIVQDRARQEGGNDRTQDSVFGESDEERNLRIITQLFTERFPGQTSLLGTPTSTDDSIGLMSSSLPPLEKMRSQLLASFPADQEALSQLAVERAWRVRDFLVHDGGVPEDRINLLESGVDASGNGDVVKTTLALTVR